MNDLVRPALYEAYHELQPVKPRPGRKVTVDVVGPVCESTDVMGLARALAPLMQGDLLCVMTAGAYGMSMASTYNSRPRPAEVLVDGARFRVVRRRETVEELFAGETP
jgi:diaminopimelate decarboxylase